MWRRFTFLQTKTPTSHNFHPHTQSTCPSAHYLHDCQARISPRGCICTCPCTQQQQKSTSSGVEFVSVRKSTKQQQKGTKKSPSRGRGVRSSSRSEKKEWWMPSVRQSRSRSRSRGRSAANNDQTFVSRDGRRKSAGASFSVSPERKVALSSLKHPNVQRL